MSPFFFGASGRTLFGIYQSAEPRPGRPAAALLCNPYGQEAISIHRLYRVLADRLVRAGMHVLRFDYYGSGDSYGEDSEGDLRGWVGDLGAAHRELARRSRSARIVWIGARLGATLAVEGARDCAPERLILWDPIFDGRAYLRELDAAAAQSREAGYDVPHRVSRGRSAAGGFDPAHGCGIQMGAALREELTALSPARIATPRAGHCDLLVGTDEHDARVIAARWERSGVPVERIVLTREFDWNTGEALSPALVPADIVRSIAGRAELAG